MRTIYTSLYTLGLLLILLSIAGHGHVSEQKTDSVNSEFNIVVTNGVTFSIQVLSEVKEITLPASGKSYSQTEIRAFSTTNLELMGAIKYAIKASISEQLQNSFPSADIITTQELPTYDGSAFIDHYNVTLSPTFFSLNETVNAYELVNGMIDCGANVNYEFSLHALPGWNNTYIFSYPAEITYRKTTGIANQNTITWKILNREGEAPYSMAEMTLADKTPSTEMYNNDSIKATFVMDCRNPKLTRLEILLNVEAINISSQKILPSLFTNMNTIPSDGIRLLIKNHMTTWNDIFLNTLEPASKTVIDSVESSSFNQTLNILFSWDNTTTTECENPYNITNMNSEPPICGAFIDNDVLYRICNLSSRTVFGLVNTGAEIRITSTDVNFGDNLDSLLYRYNGSVIFPSHIFLNNQQNFEWNKTSPIEGEFSSDIAPSYLYQDINTAITIEHESSDINLLSFLTGKIELTVGLFLSETQLRNVSTIPPPLKLPPQISLKYLDANGFRLCVEESVFTNEQIDSFLRNETKDFENRAKAMFPLLQGKAQIDKTSFQRSLQWDGDIAFKNTSNPVEVSSTFHSSYPLSFSFSIFPPGVILSKQNISFTSIPNQSVAYTMVFPEGLSVKINDTLKRAAIQENLDGKLCLLVTFNASEGDVIDIVSISMQPSILYIIGLFLPCFITFFIIIFLLIIVYVIRNRKIQSSDYKNKKLKNNTKGKKREEPEDDDEDVEYTPPKPPPRRR